MGILKRGRKIMVLTCKFLWLKKNGKVVFGVAHLKVIWKSKPKSKWP